jgi:hypothetical protein
MDAANRDINQRLDLPCFNADNEYCKICYTSLKHNVEVSPIGRLTTHEELTKAFPNDHIPKCPYDNICYYINIAPVSQADRGANYWAAERFQAQNGPRKRAYYYDEKVERKWIGYKTLTDVEFSNQIPRGGNGAAEQPADNRPI